MTHPLDTYGALVDRLQDLTEEMLIIAADADKLLHQLGSVVSRERLTERSYLVHIDEDSWPSLDSQEPQKRVADQFPKNWNTFVTADPDDLLTDEELADLEGDFNDN